MQGKISMVESLDVQYTQSGRVISGLEMMKDNVEKWHRYWKPNIQRFHEMRRFVFQSNITDIEAESLGVIQKPALEFNIIEAYMSKARGEFAQQEPTFDVEQAPDAMKPVHPFVLQMLKGHLEAIHQDSKKNDVENNVVQDQMSGGYSAMKVVLKFQSIRSFNQVIAIENVFDPTLCGWDPTAKTKSKTDGDYAFEIIPLTLTAFKQKYPKRKMENNGAMYLGDFKWSYRYGDEPMVLVCRYWGKSFKRKKLLYIAANPVSGPEQAMFKSEYNELLERFQREGRVEQPPAIIGDRMVDVPVITEHLFYEHDELDEEETYFTKLPLIFVDGNSANLRQSGDNSELMQFTRPIFKNATDLQRLKNIAGQCMANELENIIQHKYTVAKEGIPEQYQNFYTDIQTPSVLIYNAFMEDQETPIPPPEIVPRQPIPPEITQTFGSADQMMQNILGGFQMDPNFNQNQMSGVAMVEAMSQSNGVTMPYVMNFLHAWSDIGQIILDLIPKVYFNERQISVINPQRRRQEVGINGYGRKSVTLNYQPGDLKVNVKPGVNFEVQKTRSIQLLMMLAQAFPSIAELINTKGLPILFDNLDFRGADQLKQLAEQQIQEQAKQPPQPSPAAIEMQKIQVMQQKNQNELQVKTGQIQADQQKTMADYQLGILQHKADIIKAAAEEKIEKEKLRTDKIDMAHSITMDLMGHMAERHDANREFQLSAHQALHPKTERRANH